MPKTDKPDDDKDEKPETGMTWRSPAELIVLFEDALDNWPGVVIRKMFGYPAGFVNGQMFTGLHEDKMVLRLSPDDLAAFLKIEGAVHFAPMQGRPMREYVVIPGSVLHDKAQLHDWLVKAFDYTQSLPPKAKKTPKKAGGTKRR